MSIKLKMFLLNILLSGTLVTVLCEPDLNPSVLDGSAVYVNQPVTINCITRGSQAMAWRSDEYIGSGQQLTFNSDSMPGATDTSPNGAQATFIRMYHDNGDLMLHSILRISVSSIYSSFTVACRNIDTGSTESVTYQTLNETITSVSMLPFEEEGTCPNNVIIECTARNSHNIQWGSSDNIGLSSIMPRCSSGDESQTYNIPGIGVISSVVQVSNSDGLVCRLTLPSEGLPVDMPLYITCINLDFQISASVSFRVPECISTTPMSTPVTSAIASNFGSEGMTTTAVENAAPKPESTSVSYEILLFGGGLLLLLVIVIVIICTVVITIKVAIYYMRKGSKTEPVPNVDHKSQRRSRTREERPRMRISDSTLTTENELDGEDSNRERARLKRAREGRDEQMDQYSAQKRNPKNAMKMIFWHSWIINQLQEITSDVDMMALVAAVDTQKEMFHEVQERNGKKKFIDTLMEDVFENTRNNSEDATGGLKKQAQANKDSKEE